MKKGNKRASSSAFQPHIEETNTYVDNLLEKQELAHYKKSLRDLKLVEKQGKNGNLMLRPVVPIKKKWHDKGYMEMVDRLYDIKRYMPKNNFDLIINQVGEKHKASNVQSRLEQERLQEEKRLKETEEEDQKKFRYQSEFVNNYMTNFRKEIIQADLERTDSEICLKKTKSVNNSFSINKKNYATES